MTFWFVGLALVVIAAALIGLASMRSEERRPPVMTSDQIDENSIL